MNERETTTKLTIPAQNLKPDMNKIYWAKIKENAMLPTKRKEDAGYDLYICSDRKEFVLKPGAIVLLPTGIASAFSSEYVGTICERGSTGSKCLSVRMGIIDSGYRDEWVIGVNNTSNKTIVITNNTKQWEAQNLFFNYENYSIHPYDKAIAQVVFTPLALIESDNKFILWDELKTISSKRGLGSLGSSKK